jgi:hypothetical protein
LLLARIYFFCFRIHTIVDHPPCNTHGSGICANAKWENAVSEKSFLPHVGDFICIAIIGNENLFKARLQGEKTEINFSW